MRADVLDVIRHSPAGAAPLRALSEALRHAASVYLPCKTASFLMWVVMTQPMM